MKFTAIFLFAAAMQVSATGKAQNLNISLKNVSLEKVFKEMQKQSGYSFLYSKEDVQKTGSINLEVKNVTLEEALTLCFKNLPFTYTVVDKVVIVKQKPTIPNEEAAIVSEPMPPINISGRVTDPDGKPLEGATVSVKGTRIITKTDANGVYILKGVESNATLEISFTEFETITLKVGNRTSLMIVLKRKETSLNEVIINKGYYTEKQKFSLGNTVHIDAKVIEQQPVSNPLLALQGRVPGMEITQSTGMNGGGVNVRIQGQNSIYNGNNPLIVVDGVPFPAQLVGTEFSMERIVQGGSPLNYINPNDIESIDILKDADATAIYGSRAANGAILINTKKGKAGKTKLTLNLQQGWGKVGHFVDMMNTRQYLDMRYEAYRNDGIVLATQTPGLNNYDLKLWDTTRYTNWQKELIGGTAQYSNFQTGLSGGTANVQYLVGATYNRQRVVFPGDFDDKIGNLHFNINASSPNQRLKLQLTASYGYDQNHLPGGDQTNTAILMEPNAPALYNQDGTLNWAPNAAGRSTWNNPLASTQSSDFSNTTKNLVSNLNIMYHVFQGVDFSTTVGYSNMQSEIYTAFRLESEKPENRYRAVRAADFVNRNMNGWNIEPQLQYAGKIGKGKIDGFLGTTIQKNSYTFLSIRGFGFASDLLMKTLTAATSNRINSSLSGITRFNALFGRLAYNWDGKYLINLTARRDGSNKFGPKARFHNFASVAAGWVLSEEKWAIKSIPFLSFGKLRGSYGTTGSDGIPDFAYLSIYYPNNPTILYQNSIGLNSINLPNPYLQWEETRKLQAGLDLGFIKDRVLLGVTYARNRSSNQLIPWGTTSVAGFTSIYKNLPALIQNTSWELMLNTVNVKTKNLSWNSSLNLTIPRNKLVSFPDTYGNSDIGKPLGYIPVVRYAGVNRTDGSYLVFDKKGNPMTGYPIEEDKTVFLSNLSRYYGGILNSIQYKGFQFDFFFQFVRKRGLKDMYYSNGARTPGNYNGGSSGNQPIAVLNRWQRPGDDATVGRFTTSGFGLNNTFVFSDAFYSYDASYIRLENVSLSWQLPAGWIKKAKLQNLRIYAHAQNLLTITKYRGLDPETMNNTTLPPLRMITTGIQVEF
ncbi:MAG: SusC/RagA family TonB-linked outer membrane protein [Chitinophagaceae bacterium]